MSKDIASLAITVDATQVVAAKAQLESLSQATKTAESGVRGMAQANKESAASMPSASLKALIDYYEQAAKSGKALGEVASKINEALNAAKAANGIAEAASAAGELASQAGGAAAGAEKMARSLTVWAGAARTATVVGKGLIAAMGGPWGAAFTAAIIAVDGLNAYLNSNKVATKDSEAASNKATTSANNYASAANAAANATSAQIQQSAQAATAARLAAERDLRAAEAKIKLVEATIKQVEAEAQLVDQAGGEGTGYLSRVPQLNQLEASLKALKSGVEASKRTIQDADQTIAQGQKNRDQAARDYAANLDLEGKLVGKSRSETILLLAEQKIAVGVSAEEAEIVRRAARNYAEKVARQEAATRGLAKHTDATRQQKNADEAANEEARKQLAALQNQFAGLSLAGRELEEFNAKNEYAGVADAGLRAQLVATTLAIYDRKQATEAATAANEKGWEEYLAYEQERQAGLETATKAAAQLEFEASLIGKNARERAILNAELFLTNNHVARGTAEWGRYMKAATQAGERELKADELTKFNASLDAMVKKTQDAATLMEKAFGSVGKAIGGMAVAYAGYAKARETADREIKENPTKRAEAELKLNQAQIKSYGDMASAAKGFFKEKSAGYKAMEKAEKAFRAIELAMALKAMLTDTAQTTTHVANEGVRSTASGVTAYAKTMASLPFPFNIAAGAVVLGLLAAVGIKIAGGKGGAVKVPTAEERQKSQGTGTVLGDASAKSDSIEKSLALIEQHTNKELEYSNPMLTALRSIDSSIGKVSDQLARQIGRPGGLFDTSGLNLGKTGSMLFGGVPLLGGLFGSKTTRTLNDVGLEFGAQSLADLRNGAVAGQGYQEVIEQTKKKFFGLTYSNKSKVSTTNSPLDEALQTSIKDVFEGVYDAVKAGAAVIGVDGAGAMLDSFVLELGKVSLKDLKGSEITDALNAVFSAAADRVAEAAVPFIDELREVGEGAFETLTRVAREYQVIDTTLASISKSFGMVGVESLQARDRLVDAVGGLDKLVEGANAFADAFLTEAERMAPVQKAVAAEMARLGYAAVDTKAEFKDLVLGLDVSTEEGAKLYAALMAVAPAFAKVADYAVQTQGVLSALTAEQQRWVDETVQATIAAAQQADMRAPSHRDRVANSNAKREADKEAAEEAAKAWDDLRTKLSAASEEAVKHGDLMAAVEAQRALYWNDPKNANYIRDQIYFSNVKPEDRDPATAKGFNVAGFNALWQKVKSEAAGEMLRSVQNRTISIPDVVPQMRGLAEEWGRQFLPEFNLGLARKGYTEALIRTMKGGAGGPEGGGLYGLLNAGTYVGAQTWAPDKNGKMEWVTGQDVADYRGLAYQLQENIDKARTAEINLGTVVQNWTGSIEDLEKVMSDTHQAVWDAQAALKELNESVGADFVAMAYSAERQAARVQAMLIATQRAAEAQVNSVFSQFASGAAALATAAREADAPVARLTDAIGRMKSISDLLNDGLTYGSADFRTSSAGKTAGMIAQAAAIAREVLTTEDAKRAAQALAANDNFAGLSGSQMRDIALMFDGLAAFDTGSFEATFMRLNDAFSHGRLTQDQYAAAVNYSLDIFEGLDRQVDRVTDAFRTLADELLVDDGLSALSGIERTLEAQRQYQETLRLALGGDEEAGGRLSGATRTYLDLAKGGAGSASEYAIIAGRVQADLRHADFIRPTSSPRLEGGEIVTELQALRNEVAQLRRESVAAQAKQIDTGQKQYKLLDRLTAGGTAMPTEDAA